MNIFKQKEIVGLDKGAWGIRERGESDAVLFPIAERQKVKNPPWRVFL
ncbi:TPA: hypothetical protein U5E44_000900 [Yersinia enterocolitica]|nr:hypothetical protein [Yersinia enterocolitica]